MKCNTGLKGVKICAALVFKRDFHLVNLGTS